MGLMFDPPRDLCLRLAPRDCPARANLAFVREDLGTPREGKEGRLACGHAPRPSPCPRAFLFPPSAALCWSRTCVSQASVTLRNLGKGVDRHRGFEAEQREASLELECQEALE